MNEEAFLRAILADPADAANRMVYADWLEERSDPRAPFLRMNPEVGRINYVAWLEKDGSLADYYVQKFPELKRAAQEWKKTQNLRNQRAALGAKLDPVWVAFISTLGCSFQPFDFFDAFKLHQLPFAEPIGTRGAIVTNSSSFRDEKCWSLGLMEDLRFLCQLELSYCAYGAADCPVHPFLCQLQGKGPLKGSHVLAALKARDFRSRYIRTLEATSIPFPGYHPGNGTGVENDEIHNDFEEQRIFQKEDEDSEEEVDEMSGTHGALKRHVADGKLWYVLLHGTPEQHGDFLGSNYVILFAVGQSRDGKRLVGVVTHQVCHNLCD